jgi:hypothetical protein
MEKKNTKSSASSATDVMGGPELSSISSNGKGTLKATTLGNQPRKFTPQIFSRLTIVDARWNR